MSATSDVPSAAGIRLTNSATDDYDEEPLYTTVDLKISAGCGCDKYSGGVLLPDGRVVFVPFSATMIGIFNPATNAYNTIAGAPGGGAYEGGVLLNDGRVVFVPHFATTIGIFNPTTNAYSTIAGAPGSTAYIGGMLLPDGRVALVPSSATTIGILSGFARPPPELCYHPCFNKF